MNSSESLATVMLLVFMALVVIWVGLFVATLFRLIGRHGETYQKLLQSSFMPVLGIPGSLTTLRFVGLRQHRALGDRALSVLSDLALVTLVACVTSMVVLIVLT